MTDTTLMYQVITANILCPANGSDGTNCGLSSWTHTATLLVPEGMLGWNDKPISLLGPAREIDPATIKGPIFELVRRDLDGPYFHAKPFGENRWCMFGGNYLTYCGNGFDSICRYPVPIHDRIEGGTY